jgi:hypothetical protein
MSIPQGNTVNVYNHHNITLSLIFTDLTFVLVAQILGTGMDTQDTAPSILLFFDKQRFIFNAGEV